MYIIIKGPSGIGKSTISKELAKNLNAKLYHFDRIMTGLNFKFKKEMPKESYIEAIDIMLPKFKIILKKQPIIFDGTFYHKEAIEHLLNSIPNGQVFTLKASLKTCLERNKTKGIVLKEETIKEIYQKNFDYGIIINAEQELNIILKEIMKAIKVK